MMPMLCSFLKYLTILSLKRWRSERVYFKRFRNGHNILIKREFELSGLRNRGVLLYIYPRVMTEVNVFATVEMSATVGEMSATMGEMSATVGGGMSATVGEMSTTVGTLNMVRNLLCCINI